MYKQPRRRRRDDGSGDGGWLGRESRSSARAGNKASQSAAETLGNIDDALAGQQAMPKPAAQSSVPSSLGDIAQQEREPGGVYDSRPDLRSDAGLRGSGASDLADQQKSADKAQRKAANATPSTDLRESEKAPDRSQFSAADDINEKLGRGYTGKGSKKSKPLSKLYSSNSSFKKKIAIAGAAAGGSVIGGTLVFLALLPLKIEHIVQNLEQHFGASGTSAVEKEEQNMMSSYLKKYVLPSLRQPGCKSTAASKDCVKLTGCGTTNPVCKMYQAWHQARLEKQLSDKYGIEFGNSRGRIYMRAPGLSSTKGLPNNSVDVTDFADGKTGNTSIFDQPSIKRTAARAAMNDALEGTTLWQKVMFRFKYGKLLEAKYGVKRCIIACKIRDNFADAVANKKNALALRVIQRVIEPRSAALASAITCLMDAACQPDQKTGDGVPDPSDPANGEVQTEGEAAVKNAVDEAATKFGTKTLDSLAGEIDALNKAGSVSNYLVQKLLSALGVSEFTKEALTKAIPIIGWINTAAEMVGNIAGWGKKVMILAVAIKSTEMVQQFAMYQTTAAELKSGNNDLTEEGSFASGLDNVTEATSTNEYQNAVNGANLPPHVPAKYSLNGFTSVQSAIQAVSGSIPGPVVAIANLWNSSIGKVLGGISGLVCDIPLVSNVCNAFGSLIGDAFKPIITWLANWLFPSVVQPIMEGADRIFPIIGGADIAYNAFAHNGLGGKVLTPAQVSAIQNEQINEQKASFDNMSTFARIFDTDSQYSLVSRLAVNMPTSLLTATNDGVSAVLTNPFSRIGGAFSSLFIKKDVFAAATAQTDPFSVTQYGYPLDDPIFKEDPQTAWDQLNCGDTSANGPTAQWNNNTVENATNGQLENTTSNPCLLIQAALQSGGGAFDTSLLPPGSQNNGDSGANSNGTGLPSGTAQQLAQQIISSPNITFQTPQEKTWFQEIVKTGKQTNCGGVSISPTLLGVILVLSQNYKLVLGVVDDGHSCGDGPHDHGYAVDINGIDPTDGSYPGTGNFITWAANEQPLLKKFYGDASGILSANGGGGMGQIQCFTSTSPPTAPSGVTFFSDTCNHVHLDVMKR